MAKSDPSERAGCALTDLATAAGCEQAASASGTAETTPTPGAESTASASAAAKATPATPTPPQTLRELERALRGQGYSQRQAAAIAREGFKAATGEPEPDPGLSELRDALQRRIASMKANHV